MHECRQVHPTLAGYPFDIPGEGANLLAYSVLSYHLPLLIAFSLQQKTRFVWGGFMLFRLQDLLTDKYGIMKVLRFSEANATVLFTHCLRGRRMAS